MNNISMFCLTMNPDHLDHINKLSFIPVGLGDKTFSNQFLSDKSGDNISKKNPFYGEYTFHYWIWKNYINNIKTDWVGFCQYRKFFVSKQMSTKELSFDDLSKISIINKIDDFKDYDCILGNKFSVENYKLIKILKNHFFGFISKPSTFFIKKKRTIKFHFDLFHGKGNIGKAINLLNEKDKVKFEEFVNENTSFNPHNMFICKTNILKSYYESIFPWLEKCENIFGNSELDGYGLKRIYGFLAERYLSYWFLRYHSVKELPIIVKDLSDYR